MESKIMESNSALQVSAFQKNGKQENGKQQCFPSLSGKKYGKQRKNGSEAEVFKRMGDL